MKRVVIATVAMFGLGALALGAVNAQGGPPGGPYPGGPGRGGRGPEMSPADREAFAEARIAALRAGLRMNADQEKLWPPVEDALRGLARQRQEARAARQERWASFRDGSPPDIPNQLRFMADRQAASADALRRVADATAPLYGTLDEAQRRRLRVLARFMGSRGPEMGRRDGPGTGGREGDDGPPRWRRGALESGPSHFAARRGPPDGPAPH